MRPALPAPRAGEMLTGRDEGPTVAAVAPQDGKRVENLDCQGAPYVGQALRVIEGESKATQYLSRLQAQQADPDELALIVSMLYGATLRGFCRAIEKALGIHHG